MSLLPHALAALPHGHDVHGVHGFHAVHHVSLAMHHSLDITAHSSLLGPSILTLLTLGGLWGGSGLVVRAAAPASSGPVAVTASSKAALEYQRPFDYIVAPLRRGTAEVIHIVLPRTEPDR